MRPMLTRIERIELLDMYSATPGASLSGEPKLARTTGVAGTAANADLAGPFVQ
jgi:hypothetical protein